MEDKPLSDMKFELIEHVGTLSESRKGWTKELNLISWNEREAKYDLRDWAPDHSKMSKGITLSTEEMKALKNLLKPRAFE